MADRPTLERSYTVSANNPEVRAQIKEELELDDDDAPVLQEHDVVSTKESFQKGFLGFLLRMKPPEGTSDGPVVSAPANPAGSRLLRRQTTIKINQGVAQQAIDNIQESDDEEDEQDLFQKQPINRQLKEKASRILKVLKSDEGDIVDKARIISGYRETIPLKTVVHKGLIFIRRWDLVGATGLLQRMRGKRDWEPHHTILQHYKDWARIIHSAPPFDAEKGGWRYDCHDYDSEVFEFHGQPVKLTFPPNKVKALSSTGPLKSMQVLNVKNSMMWVVCENELELEVWKERIELVNFLLRKKVILKSKVIKMGEFSRRNHGRWEPVYAVLAKKGSLHMGSKNKILVTSRIPFYDSGNKLLYDPVGKGLETLSLSRGTYEVHRDLPDDADESDGEGHEVEDGEVARSAFGSQPHKFRVNQSSLGCTAGFQDKDEYEDWLRCLGLGDDDGEEMGTRDLMMDGTTVPPSKIIKRGPLINFPESEPSAEQPGEAVLFIDDTGKKVLVHSPRPFATTPEGCLLVPDDDVQKQEDVDSAADIVVGAAEHDKSKRTFTVHPAEDGDKMALGTADKAEFSDWLRALGVVDPLLESIPVSEVIKKGPLLVPSSFDPLKWEPLNALLHQRPNGNKRVVKSVAPFERRGAFIVVDRSQNSDSVGDLNLEGAPYDVKRDKKDVLVDGNDLPVETFDIVLPSGAHGEFGTGDHPEYLDWLKALGVGEEIIPLSEVVKRGPLLAPTEDSVEGEWQPVHALLHQRPDGSKRLLKSEAPFERRGDNIVVDSTRALPPFDMEKQPFTVNKHERDVDVGGKTVPVETFDVALSNGPHQELGTSDHPEYLDWLRAFGAGQERIPLSEVKKMGALSVPGDDEWRAADGLLHENAKSGKRLVLSSSPFAIEGSDVLIDTDRVIQDMPLKHDPFEVAKRDETVELGGQSKDLHVFEVEQSGRSAAAGTPDLDEYNSWLKALGAGAEEEDLSNYMFIPHSEIAKEGPLYQSSGRPGATRQEWTDKHAILHNAPEGDVMLLSSTPIVQRDDGVLVCRDGLDTFDMGPPLPDITTGEEDAVIAGEEKHLHTFAVDEPQRFLHLGTEDPNTLKEWLDAMGYKPSDKISIPEDEVRKEGPLFHSSGRPRSLNQTWSPKHVILRDYDSTNTLVISPKPFVLVDGKYEADRAGVVEFAMGPPLPKVEHGEEDAVVDGEDMHLYTFSVVEPARFVHLGSEDQQTLLDWLKALGVDANKTLFVPDDEVLRQGPMYKSSGRADAPDQVWDDTFALLREPPDKGLTYYTSPTPFVRERGGYRLNMDCTDEYCMGPKPVDLQTGQEDVEVSGEPKRLLTFCHSQEEGDAFLHLGTEQEHDFKKWLQAMGVDPTARKVEEPEEDEDSPPAHLRRVDTSEKLRGPAVESFELEQVQLRPVGERGLPAGSSDGGMEPVALRHVEPPPVKPQWDDGSDSDDDSEAWRLKVGKGVLPPLIDFNGEDVVLRPVVLYGEDDSERVKMIRRLKAELKLLKSRIRQNECQKRDMLVALGRRE